eukprot:537508-Rhodomonas_salina.3
MGAYQIGCLTKSGYYRPPVLCYAIATRCPVLTLRMRLPGTSRASLKWPWTCMLLRAAYALPSTDL